MLKKCEKIVSISLRTLSVSIRYIVIKLKKQIFNKVFNHVEVPIQI